MRRTIILLLFIILMLFIAWYFQDITPLINNTSVVAPECQIAVPTPIPNADPANSCTVKIGVINTFATANGCHAGGTEHKRGYEIALNELNSLGGINGCQIELVQIDDRGDSVAAGTAVITLAEQGDTVEDSIPLIIGAYSSRSTLAAAEEADAQEIPLIVPSASSALITLLGFEWIFRINADSDDYVNQAIALTSTIDDSPTIGILHENTLFGESAAVAVISKAEQEGIGVAAYETYQPNEEATNLYPAITTLKSANPDVVYLISNNIDDSINILETSEALNFTPKLFIANAGAFVSPDFLEKASAAAENVVVTAQWAEDVTWHFEDEGNTDVEDFINQFRDAYDGDTPGMRSVQTYTSLRLAKEVIEQALDRESCNTSIKMLRICVQAELRQLDLEHTIFGAINFDDTTGQNDHPVLLVQIVCNGERDAEGDCLANQFHFVTVFPEEYRSQDIILPRQEADE